MDRAAEEVVESHFCNCDRKAIPRSFTVMNKLLVAMVSAAAITVVPATSVAATMTEDAFVVPAKSKRCTALDGELLITELRRVSCSEARRFLAVHFGLGSVVTTWRCSDNFQKGSCRGGGSFFRWRALSTGNPEL